MAHREDVSTAGVSWEAAALFEPDRLAPVHPPVTSTVFARAERRSRLIALTMRSTRSSSFGSTGDSPARTSSRRFLKASAPSRGSANITGEETMADRDESSNRMRGDTLFTGSRHTNVKARVPDAPTAPPPNAEPIEIEVDDGRRI